MADAVARFVGRKAKALQVTQGDGDDFGVIAQTIRCQLYPHLPVARSSVLVMYSDYIESGCALLVASWLLRCCMLSVANHLAGVRLCISCRSFACGAAVVLHYRRRRVPSRTWKIENALCEIEPVPAVPCGISTTLVHYVRVPLAVAWPGSVLGHLARAG